MIKLRLHKHAIYLAKKIGESTELFRGKADLMSKVFSSAALKRIIAAVDDMSELKNKTPHQLLYELAFTLVEIHANFKS